MPSQKNGAISRQVVGYDRLVGEHASCTGYMGHLFGKKPP